MARGRRRKDIDRSSHSGPERVDDRPSRPRRSVTRRSILRALGIAPLLPLTGCFGDDWDSFEGRQLRLATGNPGGVFARYGDALGAVLASRIGVVVDISQTDASVENLRLVGAGKADIGMTLGDTAADRSEEHTSELQSRGHLVCRLLLEKKKEANIEPPSCTLLTMS